MGKNRKPRAILLEHHEDGRCTVLADRIDRQRPGFFAGDAGRPFGHARQGDAFDRRMFGQEPGDRFDRHVPVHDVAPDKGGIEFGCEGDMPLTNAFKRRGQAAPVPFPRRRG
jgi:hypothetical protein